MSSDLSSVIEDTDTVVLDRAAPSTDSSRRGVVSRLEPAPKPSTLVSRNVTVDGHRTSCRLEPYMWDALYDICARERMTIHVLCTMINQRKDPNTSLTAAIRVFALAYFRAAATEDGHFKVQHGRGKPFHDTPFAGPDGSDEDEEEIRVRGRNRGRD